MTVSGTGPADPSAIAASLAIYGGAEATVAQASLALEQSAENSREIEQQAENMQRAAARERIAEQREAAEIRMWTGIAQGAVQAGAGAAQLAGAGEGSTHITNATGTGGGAIGEFLASNADRRADEASLREDSHRDLGEDAAADADKADGLQNRALDHLGQIAQARMDARLTASRG